LQWELLKIECKGTAFFANIQYLEQIFGKKDAGIGRTRQISGWLFIERLRDRKIERLRDRKIERSKEEKCGIQCRAN